MREFSPRLMLVNFWDMDVAHWGSYSLYLNAITRTDRLTGMLWDEIQTNPAYNNKTTMLVLPELGRDGMSDCKNQEQDCKDERTIKTDPQETDGQDFNVTAAHPTLRIEIKHDSEHQCGERQVPMGEHPTP